MTKRTLKIQAKKLGFEVKEEKGLVILDGCVYISFPDTHVQMAGGELALINIHDLLKLMKDAKK